MCWKFLASNTRTHTHARTHTKTTYALKQNVLKLENGFEGGAFTLIATPIAGNSTEVGAKSARSSFQQLNSNKVCEFSATTIYQLYAGKHGTTKLVVVCRIEEGIKDAEEAKSGEFWLPG